MVWMTALIVLLLPPAAPNQTGLPQLLTDQAMFQRKQAIR
jgi:hypothetical protein